VGAPSSASTTTPAILASPRAVDLFVYTPEEFDRMRSEERPFLTHALEGAKLVHEGCEL